MSEQLAPTNPRKPAKRKDQFSKIHKLVFQATFTAWAIYECAKFVKFLWLTW
jgi:hypothetical protein